MFQFFKKSNTKSISVNEIQNMLGKINLIDIREPYEYKSGHIPSAKSIPMNTLISSADKYLQKDKEYHIICQSGSRSSAACGVLSNQGFNVINVSGGTGFYPGKLER